MTVPQTANRPGPAKAPVVAQDQPLLVQRAAQPDLGLWDAFVAGHPAGSFFHTTAWIESMRAACRGSQYAGMLPLACVPSLLGGTMPVSVT